MAATSTSVGQSANTISDAFDSAKATVGQVTNQVVDQVKGQALSRVDQQRQSAASGVHAVAEAFHKLGEHLESRDNDPIAGYTSQVGHALAEQVEKVAGYLDGRDINQIVAETQQFARRSPAVFLGGAFLLGLAASRFLKSSRPTSGVPDINASMPDPSRALPPAASEQRASAASAGGF